MTRRGDLLRQLLKERVLCLDGATGTFLQGFDLGPEDFGGAAFEGCNEILVETRPDLLRAMHRGYLEAGADIVETNSFGSTSLVLAEYPPLHLRAAELTRKAAQLAREAADALSTADRPRFVAGSMGPTTKSLSLTGGVTFTELVDAYAEQAQALIEGGADYLLLETCQDTRNIKAGLVAIEALRRRTGLDIPVAVSGTIEANGTMLAGQGAESLVISLDHEDLLYVGLNCATGPAAMADSVRAMAELSRAPVFCVPNAGLPDADGNYAEGPEQVAAVLGRYLERGWLNGIGGCCGTTAEHIRHLSVVASSRPPRAVASHHRALFSGLDWVESTPDNRPLLVGERSNVIGSRKFRRLIASERFEEAAEVARAQVKAGAHVVDVCVANPDRDELSDMDSLLAEVTRKVKAPLMIDSTDPAVVERALQWSQGKAIINSVNLEDGEERFAQVVPLARRYGAALVVGLIDEDPEAGMAVTRQRKLDIARRSARILTEGYGVPLQDIVFDPLVFPCATGDAAYLGSATETVEGLRLIKEEFPEARTVLGISNVSFGLPPAGREVINSVFLYRCTQAGLDLAIVNSQKLQRYASISEADRALAEAVLFDTSDEAIAAFVERFRGVKSAPSTPRSDLPVEERLAALVVEGSKEGLIPDLDELRARLAPLDIINGPLMAGMAEVGRLFNGNQLIVAEVLQSAEVMKAAVSHLERFLEADSTTTRGKVVLATVKGDVHDIGKNLVEIILSNNGYEVIDLGIKVPPQRIAAAVREHEPDIVGLSGLLVKSTRMMVDTAEELAAAGLGPDLLLGGAALTRRFVRSRVAPAYGGTVAYAPDAMAGLALAGRLVDPAQRAGLDAELGAEQERFGPDAPVARKPARPAPKPASPLSELPAPPDLDEHADQRLPLGELWGWINERTLFNKHLGFRGSFARAVSKGDPKALELRARVAAVQEQAAAGRMRVRAVWRWFAASGDGDSLTLRAEAPVTWTLPRQPGGLALPDFVAAQDSAALFVVSAGEGVRAWATELKEAGEFLDSHIVQALALETAEAAAEWLHARLRAAWGFADPEDMTMRQRFGARYRGCRYSPGYAACPELSMQADLWRLLRPDERIGVQLTDGYMMDPEASVSALVLHHPEARYFDAG